MTSPSTDSLGLLGMSMSAQYSIRNERSSKCIGSNVNLRGRYYANRLVSAQRLTVGVIHVATPPHTKHTTTIKIALVHCCIDFKCLIGMLDFGPFILVEVPSMKVTIEYTTRYGRQWTKKSWYKKWLGQRRANSNGRINEATSAELCWYGYEDSILQSFEVWWAYGRVRLYCISSFVDMGMPEWCEWRMSGLINQGATCYLNAVSFWLRKPHFEFKLSLSIDNTGSPCYRSF